MKKENGRGFVKRCRWRGPLAFAVTASIIVMALLIFPAGAALAQTVLTNQVPTNENFSDSGGPYELGMTFSSTSAGNITAIRHWKAFDDNATHVGRIWDAGGNQLAEVTFADNTGSGWKQQALTTPLAIEANTTYVVSVNSGAAGDSGSFYPFGSDLPVTNGDLTGSQGVFIDSPGSFPNVFVDVPLFPRRGCHWGRRADGLHRGREVRERHRSRRALRAEQRHRRWWRRCAPRKSERPADGLLRRYAGFLSIRDQELRQC